MKTRRIAIVLLLLVAALLLGGCPQPPVYNDEYATGLLELKTMVNALVTQVEKNPSNESFNTALYEPIYSKIAVLRSIVEKEGTRRKDTLGQLDQYRRITGDFEKLHKDGRFVSEQTLAKSIEYIEDGIDSLIDDENRLKMK